MPIITLPDGNNLDFSRKVTGLEVAEKISKSLAKQALIMSVDGELKDLYFLIEKDSKVKIISLTKQLIHKQTKFVLLKGKSYLSELQIINSKKYLWETYPSITSNESKIIIMESKWLLQ